MKTSSQRIDHEKPPEVLGKWYRWDSPVGLEKRLSLVLRRITR